MAAATIDIPARELRAGDILVGADGAACGPWRVRGADGRAWSPVGWVTVEADDDAATFLEAVALDDDGLEVHLELGPATPLRVHRGPA